MDPSPRELAAAFDRLDVASLRRRRSEKWGTYPADVLPAWVAEMDFPVAAAVHEALAERVAIDDYGYPLTIREERIPEVFAARMAERFGWSVDPERVEVLADVVQGIHVAIDRFTAPGEGVVVQTPVYPPFLGALPESGRRLVENPLVWTGARYEMDLDGLRTALGRDGAHLLLLCHPQNPTGRVFTRAELEALADVVLAHDLVVVSDEIHGDLAFAEHPFVPFASLGPEVAARTITLTSATKAFNIPGLRCAVAAFGSRELHRRFAGVPRHLRGGINLFGLAATRAAWEAGQPWLDAVLDYLADNRARVARWVAEALPGAVHRPPEASYLAWIDCRGLGLGPSPQRFFLERARVALSPGEAFGRPGAGFVRLNFGTSRAILEEILERLGKALRER